MSSRPPDCLVNCNRLFPSSPQSLFQSASRCEIFVLLISSSFSMNEDLQDFALRLKAEW